MAQPRIVLDWDDTCVDGVWPERYGTWKPGAVDAIRELANHAEIVVSTCRIAPVGLDGVTELSEGDVRAEVDAIRNQLDDAGLTMVGIWTKPFKPRAVAYVDDKAVHYTGSRTAWSNLVEKLTAMVEVEGKSKKKSKRGSSKNAGSRRKLSTPSA